MIMKLANKITLIVMCFLLPSIALAHSGMHAAGQAHVGENHMGLLEVSMAVIAIIVVGIWSLKTVKTKK
jgi:hypothetical protein